VFAVVAVAACLAAGPARAGTTTVTASADARVEAANAATNFGTSTTLAVDNSPIARTYVRFVVPSLGGASVTRATLRLNAGAASSAGWRAHVSLDTTWSEGGITYANAPGFSATVTGATGKTSSGWTQADVTSSVAGPGTYSFVVDTTSNTRLSLKSRESGANGPQLVLTTGSTGADTAPPTDPTNLHTTSITQTSVTLAWTASTDNVGVDHYTVFAGTAVVATVTGTTATATNLTCGSDHAFTVKAFDLVGNASAAAPSPALGVRTQACSDTTPPSDPSNLGVTSTDQTSVSLQWDAATDDSGSIAQYKVFESSSPAAAAIVPGTQTAATVSGLACGSHFTFTVQAFDAAGNWSNAIPAGGLGAATDACSPASADPVIEAAGDIACPATMKAGTSSCAHAATSDILVADQPDAVLTLGDNQYNCGELDNFNAAFDTTWGRIKSRIHPAPGNHEYVVAPTDSSCLTTQTAAGAPGYFTYFGDAASPLDAPCRASCRGYYSFDIGNWHMIALNSNCSSGGALVGCGTGSPQETWLKADLAAVPASKCILAYDHYPRYSSGEHGANRGIQALWADLYDAHVDVFLSAHDHDYERFAQLGRGDSTTTSPTADANGIRQFVVGTGGKSHYPIRAAQPASEVFDATTFGILKLTLHADSYDWQFRPVAGGAFSDAGTTSCHL
jgi:chitodextrinase